MRVNFNGVLGWNWTDVMHDLKEQGGVEVVIDPLSVTENGCGGYLDGKFFYITWAKDKFLVLTMIEFSQPLVDAFSTVIEYQPFCRYNERDLPTVEWDKMDPDGRFAELTQQPAIQNLVRIESPEERQIP